MPLTNTLFTQPTTHVKLDYAFMLMHTQKTVITLEIKFKEEAVHLRFPHFNASLKVVSYKKHHNAQI